MEKKEGNGEREDTTGDLQYLTTLLVQIGLCKLFLIKTGTPALLLPEPSSLEHV